MQKILHLFHHFNHSLAHHHSFIETLLHVQRFPLWVFSLRNYPHTWQDLPFEVEPHICQCKKDGIKRFSRITVSVLKDYKLRGHGWGTCIGICWNVEIKLKCKFPDLICQKIKEENSSSNLAWHANRQANHMVNRCLHKGLNKLKW